MAINTNATLKTAVTTWMMSAGDVTTNADDIVTLAQGFLNTAITHREMTTTTTLSPTSGVFTLPANYRAFRRITEVASIRRVLRPVTYERAEELYPDRPSGLGEYFVIYGDSLRVYPTITNDIEVFYVKLFTAFSAAGDTDWLLTSFPHIYLKACQMVAADLIKDEAEYTRHAVTLQAFIDQLHATESTSEFANAPMALEGPTP